MVQKVFGICEAKNGTETDELLQAGAVGHPRMYGNMLKRIQVLEDGRVPAAEARSWRIEGPQKITRIEYQRLLNKFEMEGFMAPEKDCRMGERVTKG